jgi:hypothetical protein
LPFQDSENKQLIRVSWDLPILQKRVEQKGGPLAYFGLCGPEMLDIRAWKTVIGDKCCVEAPGNKSEEKAQLPFRLAQMATVAQVYGIASGFQQLVGKIEDVLLNGLDDKGMRPVLTNVNAKAQETRFNYDLYNLDFDGGLGYVKKGGSVPRFRALEKLFDRQRDHAFTLLLTVNVRNKVVGNLESYLQQLRKRSYGNLWKETIDWHLEQGKQHYGYILKAAVPIFIHKQAEAHGFKPHCFPAVVYEGHNQAVLVHFAFNFEVVVGSLGGVGPQEEHDLLDLPFLESSGGLLSVISHGSPTFESDACAASLSPIPVGDRAGVVSRKNTSPVFGEQVKKRAGVGR